MEKRFNSLYDDEIKEELEKVWEALDKIVNMTGLNYNLDGYVLPNVKEIDCADEMLESLDTAYMDIGYYLGRR